METSGYKGFTTDFEKIKSQVGGPIQIVYSDDEDVLNIEDFTELAQQLGASLTVEHGKKHFFGIDYQNDPDFVVTFPAQHSQEESDEYFQSRPWSSQIGAWASQQSAELANREELEMRFKGAAEKWPEGSKVPTPPHWGGFIVKPFSIEFWQGRYSRLHDRIRFERSHNSGEPSGNWEARRYYP